MKSQVVKKKRMTANREHKSLQRCFFDFCLVMLFLMILFIGGNICLLISSRKLRVSLNHETEKSNI
jgi:hypothetical protein